MEKILIEFIATLDASLREMESRVRDHSGFSRLTVSQLRYIDAIADLGEASLTEIAESLNITRASVTATIKKLIRMKLVIKTQSIEDQRVYYVSLTRAGQVLVRARTRAIREYGKFIRSALSEDEVRRFTAIMTKLVRQFNQE